MRVVQQTARMHAASTPPRCDMLPRLKQVTVQPIEPKREPLAWIAVRKECWTSSSCLTAMLSAEEAGTMEFACIPVFTSPGLQT
jgi:hypothetical protein